jgi:hypothetical protein
MLEPIQTGNIRFDLKHYNKIKNKKCHTVGTVSKYKIKVVEKA